MQKTKSQQADPSLLLGLHQKLPAPAETRLEQAMKQRAQPFPVEAGFSSRGEMRLVWEVWEQPQAS